MKRNLIFLFIFTHIVNCTATLYAGDRKKCVHHALGEDIYKHYTGTIGNKKVVLDLRYGFCGASNYGGSYFYYPDDNETRCLIIYEPKSFDHTTELTAREQSINYYWGNHDDVPSASWSFVIKDNHLTGRWTSADKKTTAEIRMTEDYSHAIRMDVIVYNDSAKTEQPGKPMRTAYFDYLGVRPSANFSNAEAYLINKEILKLTGTDHQGIVDMEILPSAIAQQRFNDFTRIYGLLPDDTTNQAWNTRNFYYSSMVFPVYNDKGLLSLELVNASAKPANYVCIDVARNKTLRLADIIKTDNDKLTALISKEYKNTADAETIKALPAEKIRFPENFMVTGKGIVFCYSSNTSPAYTSEVRVFLSFAKLGGMLTKDFRTRMGI